MIIPKTQRSWDSLVIALVFISAAFLRLYHLDADPPTTVGLHFISDEGWWVHNARNKVLFDQWVLDEFNQSLLASPTFCMGTYGIYSILGVSYLSSRVLPVLSGLLTLLLFAGILRNNSPPRVATLGTFLFGCNFAFTALNRTAYVDSTGLLFLMLAWWFLDALHERVWAVYLAGMSFALAIVTKSYFLSVLPPVGAVLLLRVWHNRSRFNIKQLMLNTVLFSGGVFSVYLLWRKYIYLPYFDEYQIMYHLWQDGNFPSSAAEFLRNIPSLFIRRFGAEVLPARFFFLNSTLLILAGYRVSQYLAAGFGSLGNTWKKISFKEQEAIVFLGILLAEIAPLTAKPFRRYILLYIPLIFLASRTIVPVNDSTLRSPGRSRLLNAILMSIGSIIAALLIAPHIANLFPVKFPLSLSLPVCMGAVISGVCILFFSFKLHLKQWVPIPLGIVLGLFLLFDGGLYLHSILNQTFSLRDTSRYLSSQYFRPGTVILGGIANSLCMESQAQALAIWGRQEAPRVLNQNPIQRFHPDYLVILKEIDGRQWGFEERYHRYAHSENFLETLRLLPVGNSHRIIADLYIAPTAEPTAPDSEKLLVQVR